MLGSFIFQVKLTPLVHSFTDQKACVWFASAASIIGPVIDHDVAAGSPLSQVRAVVSDAPLLISWRQPVQLLLLWAGGRICREGLKSTRQPWLQAA